MSMEIKTYISALFCTKCNNIIFSRAVHDYRRCDCGNCSVDGGSEYFKTTIHDEESSIFVMLDSEIVLRLAMFSDYNFQNSNAKEYPQGYFGKYVIRRNTNLKWIEKLVINYDDIKDIAEEVIANYI